MILSIDLRRCRCIKRLSSNKMHIEFCEPCRTFRRGLDSYISSRKLFLLLIIFMLFLMYIGPGIFHWLWKRAPNLLDSNAACIESHVNKYVLDNFDTSVSRSTGPDDEGFLPYIGNGKIGLSVRDKVMFVYYKRALALQLNYQPIVETDILESKKQEAMVVQFTSGIVYKFQCFHWKHGSVSVVHKFIAHRVFPSVLLQVIEVINPTDEAVTVSLKGSLSDEVLHTMKTGQNQDGSVQYHMTSDYVSIPESSAHIVYSACSLATPGLTTVEPRSSKTLVVKTSVHYSNPIHLLEKSAVEKSLENRAQEELLTVFDYSLSELMKTHIDVWEKIWHSGFSISLSRAQKALNGDKINATLYYVLSNTREYFSEAGTSPQRQQILQHYLYSPDKCYGGHHTLQASTLWSDLKSVSDVNNVVSLWLLTLNKKGCHNLIEAGARGVMQAMILSFGGFKFSNHHLEFDCDPKDLHRDYHFRRIIYGNSTHINISVIVQEDNKALILATLDRSDKDYYGCDAGCLGMPVKLGSEAVQFPVKITNPLTSILYITADKQHMEELRHTIHVKGVVEAPAHEHHIIALHRHGHQLGGLPAFFWVSVAFLIAIFHLFLIKLIYNEYCGGDDKLKRRYHV